MKGGQGGREVSIGCVPPGRSQVKGRPGGRLGARPGRGRGPGDGRRLRCPSCPAAAEKDVVGAEGKDQDEQDVVARAKVKLPCG